MEIFIKSVVGHGSNISCKKMSYLKIYSKNGGGGGGGHGPSGRPFSAVHDLSPVRRNRSHSVIKIRSHEHLCICLRTETK